jgi:hypothetical protein
MARNSTVKILEHVSKILDANARVLELVHEDLVRITRPDTGRRKVSAEQELSPAVLKKYRELTALGARPSTQASWPADHPYQETKGLGRSALTP